MVRRAEPRAARSSCRELSETNGALSFGSLGRPVALQEMAPRLAAALDGDPATAVPAA
ncbi:MAG: hypothetical protein L0I24_03985 [Pseudonocardia sp.]|nr:hypothetical protein [Pseudonocardia sp.]